jgi:Domain of unknown function (DUF4748)
VKSFWYISALLLWDTVSNLLRVGWGSLCVAGGGAYYFAKQSINSDRQQRHEEQYKQRQVQDHLEHSVNSAMLSPSPRTKTKATTPKPINSEPEERGAKMNGHIDKQDHPTVERKTESGDGT